MNKFKLSLNDKNRISLLSTNFSYFRMAFQDRECIGRRVILPGIVSFWWCFGAGLLSAIVRHGLLIACKLYQPKIVRRVRLICKM